MIRTAYLAIDIGASNGRHIVKTNTDELVEVYRFENFMNHSQDGLIWDIERLWTEIKTGIKIACETYPNIGFLGIDTWGVDYVLLDNNDPILPAYAYRNKRTETIIDQVHNKISFEDLYQITGCQHQPFNSIYQLYDDKLKGRLDNATDFLLLPEYFYYLLTGVKVHEYTNATTTGMLNVRTKDFDKTIIQQLELPERLFQTPVAPGYRCDIKKELQAELGFTGKAVLVATHDTASAIEGVSIPENSIFLSSGTWSLIGVKINDPLTTIEAREANFSHEGGIDYLRFQKNIMGLWIIQKLKEEWNIESFSSLIKMAKCSEFDCVFDVNEKEFLSPVSMENEIRIKLQKLHQVSNMTKEDIICAVYHSLAISYQDSIDQITQITNRSYDSLIVFGGGAKIDYLNQLIVKYVDLPVTFYPVEATALGNLKVQQQ